MTDSTPTIAQQLRARAAEAMRISQVVPDGTKAALEKIAADFLEQAARLEAKAEFREAARARPGDERHTR